MTLLQLALAAVFALAAVGCFGSLRLTSKVSGPDTKRGLNALLALSGTWAVMTVVRLVSPSQALQIAAYIVGLVAGLATIGAWLYFCSAYTGHEYHRNTKIRRTALLVYFGIVAVKITNPFHGMYFTTAVATDPFRHVVINLGIAHWIVTGLSYALTAIGFFLLYQMFAKSTFKTKALGALVGVTALPAVLDIFSYTGRLLLTLNYEPIGVALFAVGVLYVIDEQFVAMPSFWRETVLEELDNAVILVDYRGTIRDYNTAALDVFPELVDTIGQPLAAGVSDLESAADVDGSKAIAVETDGTTRYYLLETTPLFSGSVVVGRALILSDVTVLERQRRELERQNEQFDDFSAAITHELRNTLAIAQGYLDVMGERVSEDPTDFDDLYRKTDRALERMEDVIGDLSTLARYGQTLEGIEDCDLRSVVTRAWEEADVEDMKLTIGTDATISADETRLTELFRNAFVFAEANGATEVTVDITDEGFVVSENGESRPPAELKRAFEYGTAVPSAETGMVLPSLRTLVRVHGWTVDSDPDYADGVRFEITNVDCSNVQIE